MKKWFIVYLFVPMLIGLGSFMISHSEEIARFLYDNYIDIVFIFAEIAVVGIAYLAYSINKNHAHS